MQKQSNTFLALFAIGLMLFSWAPARGAESTESKEGTLQQRRAARSILGKYRRARRDFSAKQTAVAEALAVGPLAVEPLFEIIDAELQPKLQRYRQQFLKSARVAASRKFHEANLTEVARLREQVNALREDPDLTKEKIISQGDPAMEKLQAMLILDREMVLSSNRRLVEQRNAMAGTGKLWEVCHEYLASLPGDELDEGEDDDIAILGFEDYLQQEETIAARLAIPMSDPTRTVLAANDKLTSKIGAEEARCVLALNLTRILLGLEPLGIDLQLVEVARGHSADMREHNFFSHDSPIPDKATPWDRAKLGGTSASGENIAKGPRMGAAANLMWFHSPGHHRNMLGNHQRVGVGQAGNYWTELFGR